MSDAAELAAKAAAAANLAAKALAGAAPLDPDAVVEQMAQEIVYHAAVDSAQAAFMTAQDYAAGAAIHGSHDLVMRVFTPQREGLTAVVAFRGTLPSKTQTLLSDLDASGIGKDQLDGNRALIEKTLTAAAGGGRVTVTGHSLGGAVAQRAACGFPSLCGRVVTFHAPGIEAKTVAALRRWNAEDPSRAVASAHYQLEKDIVEEAGEALTDGTIHRYKLEDVGSLQLMELHSTYILADVALAHGRTLPAQDSGRRVVFVGDAPSTSKKTTPIEVLRASAGTVVDGAVTAAQTAVKVESKVEDGLEDGAKKAGGAVSWLKGKL
jgi:hypothetical protein